MSYSFDGVLKFKVGERYWECQSGQNYNFEVVSEPILIEDGPLKQVIFYGKDLESGEEHRFLLTKGMEHYGPRIYDHPAYVDLSYLREETNETD